MDKIESSLVDACAANSTLRRHVLSFILSLLVISVVFYITSSIWNWISDKTHGERNGCQSPPQLPNRWPLGLDRLRNLWVANADGHLLEYLCSIAARYESLNNMSEFLLLGPRVYHILDPENIETVLLTKFTDYGFGLRSSVFAPLLGEGIFTQEGVKWKHSRELLRKQFSRIQYQNTHPFREYVDNLIGKLPDNGVIDLQPLFFSLTLDTTTALLLGQSVNSLKASGDGETKNQKFADNFSKAQEGLAKRFRIAPWQFLYRPKSFLDACSGVHEFMDDFIDRWSSETKQQQTDSKEKNGFINQVAYKSTSRKEIRDQLLNVLLAGRDSVACTLTWIFRLLVRHEWAMKRLRTEIRAVMSDGHHPSREQIRRMHYLDKVIKESLRLYPPAPINQRTAIRTTVLPTGGPPDGISPILVRKGEVISFSPYVNSRKKNIYGPDANAFRPERWETGELDDIGWGYFPFNGGPRMCLGKDYALMLVSYVTIRLLQAHESITLPGGERNEPPGTEKHRLTLVLSSADGCRVQLNKQA